MGRLLVSISALLLFGCDPSPPPAEPASETTESPGPAAGTGTDTPAARLEAILDAQPDDVQARYEYRHPQETLEFFGIEPGMTVVEALPGSGWYSKILIPYLGPEGRLVGANYAQDMWPKFGFFEQDFIDSMKTWTTDWPNEARQWGDGDGADIAAFELGSLPSEMEGTADVVLVVRALHNLARFQDDGDFLATALRDMYRVAKPGGIVGVVQHQARDDMPDEWAGGSAGYLKRQFVIDRMQEAGFEYVSGSSINENPADRPTKDDVVWRLPPSYQTSADDPDLRAEMDAIGESNRMTLKFRKPM